VNAARVNATAMEQELITNLSELSTQLTGIQDKIHKLQKSINSTGIIPPQETRPLKATSTADYDEETTAALAEKLSSMSSRLTKMKQRFSVTE